MTSVQHSKPPETIFVYFNTREGKNQKVKFNFCGMILSLIKRYGGIVLKTQVEVMIGNYAIARGFVEAGLDCAAAYPGTPSSEIIPGIIEFNKREQGNIYIEWSVNERCAFEVAFGAALVGKQAVCIMKQVGLNVAFPSLLKGKNKAIKGAFVIVSCDDPGPQSSQTEQDTRLIAALFGIPVFDPASPKEAGDTAFYALKYSFEHKVPVILRSTHRVSHAREAIPVFPAGARKVLLNQGVQIGKGSKLGIIASGMSCSLAIDVLEELGVEENVSLYKAVQIFPPDPSMNDFVRDMEKILVIEETDAVLEGLIDKGDKVFGRRNRYVPGEGELTYDAVKGIIERVLDEMGLRKERFLPDNAIKEALATIEFSARPPKLCAGCSHRASFYAMKRAFPDAVFPGDIGCYTLGISMGAVDTCLDMGSGVNFAAGFYDTFNQDNNLIPILASIGDSTFFHACLTPLYDAALKGKRFILVIMDNSTTAMTGMQPTPQQGKTADGTLTRPIRIEDVIEGFGIDFLRIVDPYDIPLMIETVREAYAHLEGKGKTPAVIIARRGCVLNERGRSQGSTFDLTKMENDCTGCRSCIKLFDCPAISFDKEKGKITIDDGLCTKCGICLFACKAQEQGKGLNKLKRRKK
ncbi:MAG: indolepyruvate oxidoreductase [Syntrophus sp. (in: bacteria)]|nr:indolepyruvate oxidoreductase [Syntrophus sp. (in: bacteria)]